MKITLNNIPYSAIIGWGKYWQKVYCEAMVGKCLANLNLNKTTCAYTIILLFKRLKELCKIKHSTMLSHVFISVKMLEFTVSAMV